MSDQDRIHKVISITNTISPTFCFAKWHHSTIYLHTQKTHSCYHPAPHAIPITELIENPAALHNTQQKKNERKLMLDGVSPNGCQYCQNIEAIGPDYISDRHIKNAIYYTPDRQLEITNGNWNNNINPAYIEVAFSNECNFKCGYCSPESSSSFYNELKKFGPYYMSANHTLSLDNTFVQIENKNTYIDSWWKWWPEMSTTLKTLRITGGEPLLHKSTWNLFDKLIKDPKPELELNLNSNFGVKSIIVDKLIENVNLLKETKSIKQFKLFSSMDTWGTRAEYIRTGLDLTLWEQNLDTFIRNTHSEVSIMCTFNILSVTSFISFLQKVLDWRTTYNSIIKVDRSGRPNYRKIRFDTPYLKEPIQYDMHLLPKEEFLYYFDNIVDFIKCNLDEEDITKFSNMEYEKFRRVRDYFATVQYNTNKLVEGRTCFYKWFTEYDLRRNTNLLTVFPEMTDFYTQCKNQDNIT